MTGLRRRSERSIPACAGKPVPGCVFASCYRVHPRVRGEATVPDRKGHTISGPSPRARGSRLAMVGSPGKLGSIPACAGKPTYPAISFALQRVHPRVRGEATWTDVKVWVDWGPSPRARGSQAIARPASPPDGSIPACAGKPSGTTLPCGRSRVHPRVRGEAGDLSGYARCYLGPSPRARGSHEAMEDYLFYRGSIPACAGKPTRRISRDTAGRVHPRVRGEARPTHLYAPPVRGPSPRARGSLVVTKSSPSYRRSIPACAGKPTSRQGRSP